jgi:hypothetical protein
MCEHLGQLQEAMGRYAAGFDTSLLSCEDAAGVVAEAAVIENLAATVKGLAAARFAAGEGWKDAGARSAAAHLARRTGTSVRQAGEVLETAHRLGKLPALAAAARAGELSTAQVAVVADAAVVDPSAEAALVETARASSLAELREASGRVKASARPTPRPGARPSTTNGSYGRGPTPKGRGTCACVTTRSGGGGHGRHRGGA